jgi:hypothetical protein
MTMQGAEKMTPGTIVRNLAGAMVVVASMAGQTAMTQAQELDEAAAAAQANNPLANVKALNFHNYYIVDTTGPAGSANTFWVRYAQPVSIGETKWLVRASLPVNSFPVPPGYDTETGLGDFNIFAAYLVDTGNPAVSFGIGPLLAAPTATEDARGSGKWQAGLANVLFNADDPKVQWGYLLTWQGSFAGDSDRQDTSFGAFQPFGMYQLGDGLYLRSTGVMTYNFKNDDYAIPIGLGLGKVFKRGSTVYNAFLEPQYTIADKGNGQPEWQIFAGFNMQFLGK